MFDVNGDGGVTFEEFLDGMIGEAAKDDYILTDADQEFAKELFKRFDVDGLGTITIDEVILVVAEI